MGNKSSKGSLSNKEKKKYTKMGIHFTPKEMDLLWNHFKTIATKQGSKYHMDRKAFKRCLGFKKNQYIDRMFQLFDEDGDGNIQFVEFLSGLNILSEKGSEDEKLEFSFMIYDFDGDGAISRDELAKMLMASLEESGVILNDQQAKACCDYTIREIIKPADPNFISKAEYVTMVRDQKEKGHDMMKALSVDVTSRIRAIGKSNKKR
jgi:serine/threonine-protein phosphatase 2B regulatory subunit